MKSEHRLAADPTDDPAAPFAEEWRRWRRDRGAPERVRSSKLHVPGWPARGKFSDYDRHRLAVMLPMHRRLIEDFVDGVHYDGAEPMPWSKKSSTAYAYDALWFLLHSLSPFLHSRSTPVFLVAHAQLCEWNYNLPTNPDSARRRLEIITASVQREQRENPAANPTEAGSVCRRHPSIAIGQRNRNRHSLPHTADAGDQY